MFLLEFRRGHPSRSFGHYWGERSSWCSPGPSALSAGLLEPPSEAKAAAFEMKKNEKLAEAAYGAMYDARPSMAKDCFDDARGYFAKAIEWRRAGLDDGVRG